MVRPRLSLILLALGTLLLAGVWAVWRPTESTESAPYAGEAGRGGEVEVPRIDLGRLQSVAAAPASGKRNLFEFGTATPAPRSDSDGRDLPQPPAPSPAAATPTPAPVPEPEPTLPPVNLKFVGTLETKNGVRIAVLLTEKREILTGQVGELLANRFRIVKIGYESVDIQDLGSDRVRRIPLKGN